MPFKIFLIVLFTSALGFAGFTVEPSAQNENLIQASQDCSCAKTPHDLFENPTRFAFGPFKGQCIDSCRFRPAIFLDKPSFKNLSRNSDEILVANVLHFHKFYVAKIRIKDFAKVSMAFEEFQPRINHVFLKFDLRSDAPDLELVSQMQGDTEVLRTRSLVISSEGVPPKDRPYSLFESYLGNYLIVDRVVTHEESQRWIQSLKNPVHYFELNFDSEKVPRILQAGLHRSHQNQYRTIYKLFTENCATSAFQILHEGIANQKNSSAFELDRALPINAPIGTLSYLIRSRLILDPESLSTQ